MGQGSLAAAAKAAIILLSTIPTGCAVSAARVSVEVRATLPGTPHAPLAAAASAEHICLRVGPPARD